MKVLIITIFVLFFITNIQVHNVFCQVKNYPVFTNDYGMTFYAQRIVYQNKTASIPFHDLSEIDNYDNVSCHYTSFYFGKWLPFWESDIVLGHIIQ